MRCVGPSGRRRKGNSIILYFRPSDGSNPRISIFPHVRFKGLMSRQRPNDGSKTAIGSFKSQRFGRNRESRNREAAERRNWPEGSAQENARQKKGAYRTRRERSRAGIRRTVRRAAKVLHTQRNCVSVAGAQFVWLGHYDRTVAAHGGLACRFSPSLIQQPKSTTRPTWSFSERGRAARLSLKGMLVASACR